MAGFIADIVATIRHLLGDNYYPPQSIFKEFIQNADDARATHLHLGWISDWEDNPHPLLQGPVFIALNDGPFSKKDEKSIRHLGLSAKGSEEGSIGRFGFGMKSIFHFCEAFFYAVSDNQEARNGKFFVELLNPWKDSGTHDDWESIKIPEQMIKKRLSFWVDEYEKWFCVLIPLRNEEHLKCKKPIKPNFSTIDELFLSIQEQEMFQFSPLLKSLREVTTWGWNSKKLLPEMKSTIKLPSKDLVPTKFPNIGVVNTQLPVRATAIGSNLVNSRNFEKKFFGYEILLDDPIFREIKQNKAWPTKANAATSEDEPEKGEPHCATIFSLNESTFGDLGKLTIQKAVFLPLTKPEETINCRGNLDFSLLLHGYYFLDSARVSPLKPSESEKDRPDLVWNSQIDQLGVYPLILPSLHKFVEETQLPATDINRLTDAIQKSEFFRDNRNYICGQSQWLKRVCDQSKDYGKWGLFGTSHEYFVLPAPPVDCPELPFQLFPNLSEASLKNIFVFDGQPKLTKNHPCKWNVALIKQLVNNLNLECLTSQDGMDYLVNFVERSFGKLELKDQKACSTTVVHSLMLLIRDHNPDAVKKRNERFFNLLKRLGRVSIVTLDCTWEIVEKLIKFIPDNELNQFLFPKAMLPKEVEAGKLSLSVADTILRKLSRGHDQSVDPLAMTRTALAVIEATDAGRQDLLGKTGDYKLFGLDELGTTKKRIVSWRELADLFEKKQLIEKGYSASANFPDHLQKAIPDLKFYTLNKKGNIEPFKLLFDCPAPHFNKDFCIEILNSRPKLARSRDRIDLLKKLINEFSETFGLDYLRAVRYLLHGNTQHHDDTNTYLLFHANAEDDNFCARLTQEALKRCQDKWFVIDPTLGNEINQNQGSRLKVKVLTSNLEEDLLGKMTDLSWINELAPTEDDYNRILKDLDNQELFRRLPIHLDSQGRRTSIKSDRAYLRCPNYKASKELENLVTVVEAPTDGNAAIYYQKFLEGWNSETALKTALESDSPSVFWKDILNCLQTFDRNRLIRLTDDELIFSCSRTSWIPTSLGPKKPSQLILLNGIEEDLRIILTDNPSQEGFFGINEINSKCLEHQAFQRVKRYLAPEPDQAMMILGDCLQNSQDYWIGNLGDRVKGSDFLNNFLLVFGKAPKELLPTGSILKALVDANSKAVTITERVLSKLARPLSKLKIKKLLDFITTRHEEVGRNDKDKVAEVFNWYLRLLVESENITLQDLSGIRLLNALGNWESTDRLCINAEGIDTSHLLNKTQADIVKEFVEINQPTNFFPIENEHGQSRMGSDDLRSYFSQFEGYVSSRRIGALLCFLGDDDTLESMAKNFLGHENLDLIRDRIKWGFTGQGLDQEKIKRRLRHIIYNQFYAIYQISGNNLCSVQNLLGRTFKANLSKSYNSIFVGESKKFDSIRKRYTVTVRPISPGNFTKNRLSEILLESTRYMLTFASAVPDNLDNLWEEWGDTEQLDLVVAQEMIVQHSMLYFRQLGGKRLTTLKQLLGKWEELEYRGAEIKIEASADQKPRQLDVIQQQGQLMASLRNDLENRPEVQEELLQAVRQKIGKEFQYDFKSIPFELFQNSDDTSTELIKMTGGTAHSNVNCIHLIWDQSRIVFIHFGRLINQFRKGLFTSQRGKELGYNRDLEKMLVLAYSDKGISETPVTGKFGLGFKSVFLVSKNPKVLSGSLGFEVVGGLYPKRLDLQDRSRLKKILRDQLDVEDGTIFEIGFEEKLEQRPKDVIKRFYQMLPVLLVFSRQIKRCHVKQIEQFEPTTLSWDETRIGQCQGAFIGNIHFPSDEEKECKKAIVLRSDDFGALLLNLGSIGVCELPDFIPTFWNLAPMDEPPIGIAINSNFELDVGRAQLAKPSERHSQLVMELGQAFGQALKSLHTSSTEDWECFRHDLGLADAATSYQFWNSFWILLGKKMAIEVFGNSLDLCKDIFWGMGRGMLYLLETSKALPSGLHGDYARLTKLGDIKWYVRGVLDTDPQIFTEISKWKSFRQHFPFGTGELVSESRIRIPLKNLVARDFDWEHVDIVIAIKCELGESGYVSPESAERLGRTINRRFLKQLKANEQEHEYLAEYLGNLKFCSLAGNLVSCKKLLILHESNVEESMKAAFAPEDSVLDPEYGLNAIEFFNACRLRMNEDINLMTEWGLKASSHEQKTAFLKYLVDGASGPKIRDLILDNKAGTWLDNIEKDPAYNALETRYQQKIYRSVSDWNNILGNHYYICEDSETPKNHNSTDYDAVYPQTPSTALNKIYHWWANDINRHVQEFENSVYPDGKFPDLNADPENGSYNKKEWLKIFLLGCLHTMGFVGGHESNKEFVRICERKTWLSLLAESDQNRTGWLEEVDRHIDKQTYDIEHYHSMRQLLSAFFIGSRLEKYIDCLMAINKINHDSFSLDQIIAPNASDFFRGSGLDAPPLRPMLGIGVHFILRELYRNKILTHKGGYSYCYMPTSGLRKLFKILRWIDTEEKLNHSEFSKEVFRFLCRNVGAEKALFCNSFDIPLQLVAEEASLQKRFLGCTIADLELFSREKWL